MKKIYILISSFFVFQVSVSFCQVSYNDVAVIVNQNDSTSMAIGNYFMQQRNIPHVNKITINVPAIEEISDSVFGAMRMQIENYITANHLDTVLNYLVTTKGCPLKILRVANDSDNCNSSVESDLMLILGSYSSYIGTCVSPTDIDYGNYQPNPYFQASTNFSHKFYDIFLVTRLDGYTIQDALSVINKGGPNRFVKKDSSLFVLDQDPAWASQPLNTALATVAPVLSGRGWQVLLNTDTVFVTNQSNVLGYQSWGSNDSHAYLYSTNAKPDNTWLAGSLAETNVSTSARSFQPGTPYGQSLIADLIAEGVSCVKGYVYEPYTIAIAQPQILWDMYSHLDGSGHPLYNMAESYFAASLMIGWKDVVIGDPKTSVTTDSSFLAVKTFESEALKVFPNPAGNRLTVFIPSFHFSGTVTVSFMNLLGEKVQSYYPSMEDGKELNFNIDKFPDGIYFVQITSEKGSWVGKFVKSYTQN